MVPAAYLILAADRPIAQGATHIAVPMPDGTLAQARLVKAHTIYGLADVTPARFRFAAIRRPADLVHWAERRGVRIAVEQTSWSGPVVSQSSAWRL